MLAEGTVIFAPFAPLDDTAATEFDSVRAPTSSVNPPARSRPLLLLLLLLLPASVVTAAEPAPCFFPATAAGDAGGFVGREYPPRAPASLDTALPSAAGAAAGVLPLPAAVPGLGREYPLGPCASPDTAVLSVASVPPPPCCCCCCCCCCLPRGGSMHATPQLPATSFHAARMLESGWKGTCRHTVHT